MYKIVRLDNSNAESTLAEGYYDEDFLRKDIIDIDVLYKESNSTKLYTVKTIKYGDDECNAFGSAKRPTLDGRKSQNTIANTHCRYARNKGAIKIETEVKIAIEDEDK